MRIGIVTFWQSHDNYGQLLQCWALQQQLIMMGHDPFLIRYNYHEYYYDKSFWGKLRDLLLVKPILRQLKLRLKLYQRKRQNAIREFELFRMNNIIMSERYYSSPKDLRRNAPKADVYITGSDQVWAQLVGRKRSMPFFLDFGDTHTIRIAYAPSFAMKSYPDELKGELKKALETFDAISVRELDGVNICRELGYKAVHVVDPTLLLKSSYYNKIIDKHYNKNSYIYIYSINISDADELRWGELKNVCQQKELEVIVTPGSGYLEGKELFDDNVIYNYSTIQQWLSNISHARMVVTTSFHGIVFSVLLHCSMIYVPLKGKYAGGNNRVEELLNTIGLGNRILCDDVFIESYFDNDIDWNDVDNRLDSMRNFSIDYINTALKR